MYGGRITSEEKSTLSTYIGLIIVTVLGAWGIYFFFFADKETKETTGFDPNRPVSDDATLKCRLMPEHYFVAGEHGIETAFQNDFLDNGRLGNYVDCLTGKPLLNSPFQFEDDT